ncbi:MAG: autotransporter-associated beta strand repeat-containing protein [Verrucomicrobiota bacterium]
MQVDGSKALPTTGAITVNGGSQLVLNGSGTYGGAGQTGHALGHRQQALRPARWSPASGNTSTLQSNISLATETEVNVQGTGSLTLNGTLGGNGVLQKIGAGTLVLSGASSSTNQVEVDAGTLIAATATRLGRAAPLSRAARSSPRSRRRSASNARWDFLAARSSSTRWPRRRSPSQAEARRSK